MSKWKKKSAPGNDYFLERINHIEKEFDGQSIPNKMAMAGALMGMGMRNKELHPVALKLARKLGPIDFDQRGKCDPFDVAKNLMSDYAKKKFGLY